MKKIKNKVIVISILVLCIISSLFFIEKNKVYKIKSAPLICIENSNLNVDTDFSLYEKNNINTVIYDGNVENLKEISKILKKNKIQLYLKLDLSLNSKENIESILSKYKKYVSGVVISNFAESGCNFQEIKEILEKGLYKVDLILQTDDIETTKELLKLNVANGFICENVDGRQYIILKELCKDEKIILHYSNKSLSADIFALSNLESIDGAVITNDIEQDNLNLITSAFNNDSQLPIFNLELSNEFTITYPNENISTYNDGMLITGVGAKNSIVNINGTDYEAEKDGSFGIYVNLEVGENNFLLKSGDNEKGLIITRKVWQYNPNANIKKESPWGKEYELEYGRIIKTVDDLTSILANPDDDSSILAGVEKDTLLKVVDTVKTKRKGYETYAYKLSNGGYVLSNKVKIENRIFEDYKKPNVQDLEIDLNSAKIINRVNILDVKSELKDSGDEVITFSTTSKPACVSEWFDGKLQILFIDSKIENIKLPQSDFYKSYDMFQDEQGVHIVLNLSENQLLWGYNIECNDDSVEVYLKHSPRKSEGNKPLENIKIVLDAGHGGKDNGALGISGAKGLTEKDLNFAIAKETQALLEKYGANVIMVRDDDTFFTLEERRRTSFNEKADLFLSIHHNSLDYSFDSTRTGGTEAYYFTLQSEDFAKKLCENVSTSANRKNRGAHQGYYYVTRTDICPAVLLESSFIINANEFSKTYTDFDIYKTSWGILQSVLDIIPE